ncbi:MAG: response regulator [Desulfopila sp.]
MPTTSRKDFSAYFSLKNILFFAAAAVLLVFTIVAVLHIKQQKEYRTHRYETITLRDDINRHLKTNYSSTCRALTRQNEVLRLFPETHPGAVRRATALLNSSREILGANIVYVLNRRGTVIASSTTDSGGTLFGNNYRFRPYFSKSMQGEDFIYAALGVTTGRRGIYFSSPITDDHGRVMGVAVIKGGVKGIDTIVHNASAKGPAVIISKDGVIFVASKKSWLFHTALPLKTDERATLLESDQFAESPLPALPFMLNKKEVVVNKKSYDIQSQPIDLVGWSVITLRRHTSAVPVIVLVCLGFTIPIYLLFIKLKHFQEELAYKAKIDRQYQRLKSLNAEMKHEIEERVEAERKLIAAKNEAEQASLAKSNFLANMSHEIRTPMNGIIGMTNIVLHSTLTKEQRNHLNVVRSSADRLLEIINNILDFSKIEAGRIDVENYPFNLHEKVDELHLLMSHKARENNVALSLKVEENVPALLNGDATRLMQILINLVSNGIKFSRNGTVSLHITRTSMDAPDTVLLRFSVQDTGVGIAPAQQEEIFESFAQGDPSTTRKFGGTGLGLSISSELCRLLGGEINLHSSENQGARFWFTIPFTHAKKNQQELEKADHGTIISSSLTHEELFKDIKILLAEDDHINKMLALALLEKANFTVRTVDNGLDAVEQLEHTQYDIILMDIQMPEMDGYEATRIIRQREQHQGRYTPIVAMTAHAISGDREKCLQAGMDEYTTKPIDATELYATLEKLLLNRVLIADRDPASLNLTARLFSDIGWQVTLAQNGEQCLWQCRNSFHDLVLTDSAMTDIDFEELSATLEDKAARTGRCVHLLGTTLPGGDRQACAAAGILAILEKPLSRASITPYLEAIQIKNMSAPNPSASPTRSIQ